MVKDLPKYDQLFQPVLDALKDLGGSAKPAEVHEHLAKALQIPDQALEVTTKNGIPLFFNRIQWARFYLVKTGYIDSSKRGVWSITEKGRTARVDDDERQHIVDDVSRAAADKTTAKKRQKQEDIEVSPDAEDTDYRQQLLDVLQGMPPEAFERLSQRLLRESGFEQVIVTGRSGDGGIDGHGVLQLNAFVSFRVLFQCKRYRGSVGAPVVRDFRGAMAGRADKGIIISTGSFTQEARREATRDGVPPIELVDGNTLVSLFEDLELGLIPRQTFELDRDFFVGFEK